MKTGYHSVDRMVSSDVISLTKDVLSREEMACLKRGLVFPKLTNRILNRIEFIIPKNEFGKLLIKIQKGWGFVVTVNEGYDLNLQYHGRFRSFLIGFGTNLQKPNQPDLKLVRIETHLENTHNNKTMAFLAETKIKGPHIHWYNSFYRLFLYNKNIGTKKPSLEMYNNIVKEILEEDENLELNNSILKKAVPYNAFLRLHKLVIKDKRKFREDGYITTNKKLSQNPKEVLNQILNKELF